MTKEGKELRYLTRFEEKTKSGLEVLCLKRREQAPKVLGPSVGVLMVNWRVGTSSMVDLRWYSLSFIWCRSVFCF